jgi:uncharacterized protein YqgC (DUF456 family)
MQPPQANPQSGAATAALVFGIIGVLGSWCLFGLPSIAAIVLGHMAARQTKNGARSGHGMGVTGLVLGYVVVIPAIIVSVILVVAFSHPAALADWLNSWIDARSG